MTFNAGEKAQGNLPRRNTCLTRSRIKINQTGTFILTEMFLFFVFLNPAGSQDERAQTHLRAWIRFTKKEFKLQADTDPAGCYGPRRSVCSPSGSSRSKRLQTRWSSKPPEPPWPRQTGSLQRGPPSQGPGQNQRATVRASTKTKKDFNNYFHFS